MTAPRWLADYVEDGQIAFRIGRDGDNLVAEWIGLGRLTASRDGKTSRFEPEPGLAEAEVEKVRHGSASLLLRHLQGKLAMHGAAVAWRGRALMLLGRSGLGKSTLAASLCAHAEAVLLSDDAIALDPGPSPGTYLLSPVEVNHWLDGAARRAIVGDRVRGGNEADEEEGTVKAPVAAAQVGSSAARLVAIVDLAFAEGEAPPRLYPVGRGVDALAALVPQAVRFVLDEPDLQRRELEQLARLVEEVQVFRLERPRGLPRVGEAHPLLLNLLEAL
jgi:hypothetical protein